MSGFNFSQVFGVPPAAEDVNTNGVIDLTGDWEDDEEDKNGVIDLSGELTDWEKQLFANAAMYHGIVIDLTK
jgi:hypothetical protein